MSTDGVLGAAFIPDDGYLDPSQLTFALADGARRLGAQIEVRTRVTGIETRDGRVVGGRDRQGADRMRGRRRRRRHVRAPGGARSSASTCRSSRSATSTSSPSRSIRRSSRCRRCATPTTSSTSAPRSAGSSWAATSASRRRGRSTASPTASRRSSSRRSWERMEELFTNAIARVPAMENAEVKAFFNGPEAFTPDADFLLGETDVPGLLDRRRRLRARARRRRRRREGHERVDRRRPSRVGRLAARLAPVRPAVPQPRVHARAHVRGAVAVLRHQVPGRGAEGRAAASCVAGISAACRAGASFGEKGGWERVNWYESNAARGDESLRPRGWAGENWSPAIEVEARAAREAVALFDQSSFSKIEVLGPGALAFLERMCANRIDRPVGTVVYTQLLNHARRDRGRPVGDAARRGPVPARHRNGVRDARPRVARAEHAARRIRLRQRRHVRRSPASASGGRRRGTCVSFDHALHAGARGDGRERAVHRLAGDVRRRARLGAVLPGRVRRDAMGHSASTA